MATITITAAVQPGAVVRAYDRHDNSYLGECVADGSGVTQITTDYPAMTDFVFLVASDDPDHNVELEPAEIKITP